MAPHSSTLAWRIHGWRSLVGCSSWGRKELATTELNWTAIQLLTCWEVKPEDKGRKTKPNHFLHTGLFIIEFSGSWEGLLFLVFCLVFRCHHCNVVDIVAKESESEVGQSCPTPSNPKDCSLPGSSIHGFSKQEYWSGVPLPSPMLYCT